MIKILVAGGTGFIGRELINFLIGQGYQVNVLSRKQMNGISTVKYFQWDVDKGFIENNAFEGVTAIINLTGANISEGRWTARRKQEIIDSRVKSINLLYKYVRKDKFPVETLISSSGVNYYGTVTTDAIFTETSENGDDFLASVCRQWEESAHQFETIGTRVVILRKGVVLGSDGGMYQKLQPMAKMGINTALGNGMQYLPWIDIGDLVRMYDFILRDTKLMGVFNAVASEHVTMNEFSAKLLQSMGKSSMLPNAPAFILKFIYGEMAVMLLNGTRVSNEKIKQRGFKFKFDTIEHSLQNKQLLEAAE